MTKVLEKDTVVIMTVKQGQEINKQFTILKDSLNSSSKLVKFWIDENKIQGLRFSDSLLAKKNVIATLENRNRFLEEEHSRIKKRIWSDRRERRFTAIGILFATMGWWTLYFLAK